MLPQWEGHYLLLWRAERGISTFEVWRLGMEWPSWSGSWIWIRSRLSASFCRYSMERKPLGWLQNSLEGPFHVRGLQRWTWECCRGEIWLKYPATPVAAVDGMQMRWMKEMVDGWREGQILILIKVAVAAVKFNVSSCFLHKFGTRNILIRTQIMGNHFTRKFKFTGQVKQQHSQQKAL